MKIVHHVLRYLPETIDGIVVYVKSLMEELEKLGIENKLTAPKYGIKEEKYRQEKIEVYRYPYLPKKQKNYKQEIYRNIPLNEGLRTWIEPHQGIDNFTSWLKQEKPDVYHLHNWKPSCGLHHLRIAKKLNLKTIVTLHSPSPICFRSTMMLYGKKSCDGLIDVKRCRNCCGSSLPSWINQVWSYMPPFLSTKLPSSDLTNALNNATFIDYRRKTLLEMGILVDKITLPCQWLYNALLINGLPKEKLVICRHGIAYGKVQMVPPSSSSDGLMKVGFLGRWNHTKGLDVLVMAIKRVPVDVPIKLVIHAFAHSDEEKAFQNKISSLIVQEDRIEIAEPVARDKILAAIASFDLLAVPSQWLETGPLVILEAQAVGTPVLGSGMGGIAELVNHGVDGWLIPEESIKNPQTWAEALMHLAQNFSLRDNRRKNIASVRTMGQVARDFIDIYH